MYLHVFWNPLYALIVRTNRKGSPLNHKTVHCASLKKHQYKYMHFFTILYEKRFPVFVRLWCKYNRKSSWQVLYLKDMIYPTAFKYKDENGLGNPCEILRRRNEDGKVSLAWFQCEILSWKPNSSPASMTHFTPGISYKSDVHARPINELRGAVLAVCGWGGSSAATERLRRVQPSTLRYPSRKRSLDMP